MMKRLRIEYGNIVLFDSDIAEISWTDSEDGVSVTGKMKKSTGGNLFDLLAGVAQNKSDNEVEQRKADYEAEKAEKAATRRTTKKAVIEEPVPVE